jgi:nucleotide-binding universal stress UspA family protein
LPGVVFVTGGCRGARRSGKEITVRILFATDGSESATGAGLLLASLPLPAGVRITVLSAIPEHNWLDTPLLAAVAADEEVAALRTAEAAAAALQGTGRQVEARVRSQSPVTTILEQADEEGADLIVVGSHGKGPAQRFLIGSVSERVARYAPCSVLVVRETARDACVGCRRVIFAVDGSASSEEALDVLAWLPLPGEAELQVVHVVRFSSTVLPPPLVPGLNEAVLMEQYEQESRATGDRIARHAQDRLDRAGREATTAVRWGAPVAELVAAAREWNADLLVVGAANHSPLARFFLGSVSAGVLHHAPCSVLVARSCHTAKNPR